MRLIAIGLALLLAGCLSGGHGQDGSERQLPGDALSRGLLWHKEFPSVRVVIHASSGHDPSPLTLSAIKQEIGRLLDKPVEVEVRTQPTNATSATVWQPRDLGPYIKAAKDEPWPKRVALMHVYAFPGCYNVTGSDPTRGCIQGITPSRVVFTMVDQIRTGATSPVADQVGGPSRDIPLAGWYEAERWLYVHELGHVVGLVQSPLPQAHDRLSPLACTCHSTAKDSVMYQYNRGVELGPDVESVDRAKADNLELYTFGVDDVADVRALQALEP